MSDASADNRMEDDSMCAPRGHFTNFAFGGVHVFIASVSGA